MKGDKFINCAVNKIICYRKYSQFKKKTSILANVESTHIMHSYFKNYNIELLMQ